jgi:carotenoid 1,2-hydratase
VFSPWYRWAGLRDPEDHVCINVALTGPHANRWAMTERGRGSLARTARSFRVGPSLIDWTGSDLVLEINEVCAPLPFPLRGRIRLSPARLTDHPVALDAGARHLWRPIAPFARVEARFDAPGLAWDGDGYLDSNIGVEPIEQGFHDWTWMRAHDGADTLVVYDAHARDGGARSLALRFGADGAVEPIPTPPPTAARGGVWGVGRPVRSFEPPRLARAWVDAPFYTRSALDVAITPGRTLHGVHEHLAAHRLLNPVVRTMLTVKMPRRP